MATELIDGLISEKVFSDFEKLNKAVSESVTNFDKSVRAKILFDSVMGDGKSLQDFKTNLEKIKALQADLERDAAKVQAATERKKFAESELGKQYAATTVEIQKLNTANKNLAREQQAAEGSINQMSASLIKLRTYYDSLSKSLRESPLGKEIVSRIQATDAALKAMDASTGRFQRNVGDYKNQLFGLTQVFRELPGFTYSAQTGILGLSNNLPILADNFKAVAAATNETTGKVNGTVGAMKIFASSIFSFGNIFAIAIGLFTIFSKQIFEFISGTKKADKATQELNDSIGKQVGKLETLTRTLDNHNISKNDHIRAAKELKELYPTALKNYSLEEIAAGKAAGAIMKIKDALVAVALARAAQADIDKLAGQAYENEKRLAELKTQLVLAQAAEKKLENAKAMPYTSPTTGVSGDVTAERLNRARNATASLKSSIIELHKAQFDLGRQMDDAANKINNFSNTATAAGIGLDGKDVYRKPKKGDKPDEKPVINPNLSDTDLADLKAYYENLRKAQITAMGEMINDPESKKAFEEFLLGGALSGDASVSDEMAAQLQKDLEKFSKEKADKLALKVQLKIDQEKAIKDFEQIAEAIRISTDMLGIIADAQYNREMQNIKNRNEAIEASYKLERQQIESKGLTQQQKAAELANMEARHEADRKKIDRDRITAERKRAQQQKAFDIANIVTTTALAIVKQLVATPLPAGAAAVALVAAAGAANLARAIATPIPQYAKGTDNHKGGAFIAGEKGAELVTLPTGKSFITPNVATLFDNMPKGTKVLDNEQTMKTIERMAFQKLANGKKVTTDSMQAAMIESFNELTNEMKGVKKEISKLKMNVSVNGNFDHYMKIKEAIS